VHEDVDLPVKRPRPSMSVTPCDLPRNSAVCITLTDGCAEISSCSNKLLPHCVQVAGEKPRGYSKGRDAQTGRRRPCIALSGRSRDADRPPATN